MKIKEFYIYGCDTKEKYDDKIREIMYYVPPVHILKVDKFIDYPGFLPYVKVRVTKKTWKKLKNEFNLCKITC